MESAFHPVSIKLVEALWREEGERYGETGLCRFRPEDVAGPNSRFVVARLFGEAVGCAAIRPLGPQIAEVKRMFVVPHARRQGVAGRLLAELERHARDLGCHTLRLETGNKQPEAISLYERSGFLRIPCWAVYAEDPVSICFEKSMRVKEEGS